MAGLCGSPQTWRCVGETQNCASKRNNTTPPASSYCAWETCVFQHSSTHGIQLQGDVQFLCTAYMISRVPRALSASGMANPIIDGVPLTTHAAKSKQNIPGTQIDVLILFSGTTCLHAYVLHFPGSPNRQLSVLVDCWMVGIGHSRNLMFADLPSQPSGN